MSPPPGTPFFLWAPPTRVNVSDLVINIVAYMPLGFAATWMSDRDTPVVRAALRAIAGCALLSLAMEWAQEYLPVRRASAIDLLGNVGGAAIGAVVGALILCRPSWRQRLHDWRNMAFMHGRLGDFGLTLITLWWLVHVNPAIALFGTTFQPDAAVTTDTATVLLEAAQTGLNFVGVLLFVALLIRRRKYFGLAATAFIGATVALKASAAALLLKPATWDHWLRPGVAIGVAVGAMVLFVAVWLPQRPRMIVCAVALLSSLIAAVLMPDLLRAQPSIGHFHWHYGHLLNFNGLTRTVLLVWPLLAAIHLLLLYGRRDEHPDTQIMPGV